MGGKVITLMSASNVIFDQVTFNGNYPDNIFTDQVDVSISRSTFMNSAAYYIKADNSRVYVDQTSFSNSSSTGYGAAILCTCEILNVSNSVFTNLTSVYGGAVYLISYSNSNYSFSNNVFDQNSAAQGGAIYIQSASTLLFTNNTFKNNSATVYENSVTNMGGAIFYGCHPDLNYPCNVTFAQGNLFVSNRATYQGGAISYINKKFFNDSTMVFQDNYATYANDISSFANSIELIFINNNDWTDHTYQKNQINSNTTLRLLQSSSKNSSQIPNYQIVSGTKFEMMVKIYDQDGLLMPQEKQAKAYLQVAPSTYVSTVLTGFQAQAINGTCNFTNVQLITKPRITVQMNLYMIDVNSYGNTIDFLVNPLVFNLTARQCAIGEKYTSDYQCVKCPIGSYNYEAPENVLDCKSCDKHAICFGGYRVAPKAGYWRSKNTSEEILECPRKESCLAGDETHPLGTCADGYEGILCTSCTPGYSKKGKYECTVCPSKTTQILELAFILFVGVFVVWLFVVATLHQIKDSKPILSVYLKLMVSHLHMISIILSIDYDWPDSLDDIVASQASASSFSNFGFSTECLFAQTKESVVEYFSSNSTSQSSSQIEVGSQYLTDASDGNSFYFKILFYALLPFGMTIIALIFWVLQDLIKRTFKDFRYQMTTSIQVLLYFCYPSIAKMMLSAFNCMSIDGTERLISDFSQVCWVDKHLWWSMGLVLPYTIFWIFGIPIIAIVFISKAKTLFANTGENGKPTTTKNELKRFRATWGFLFNGYEIKTLFWEIVILYRKILIIVLATFIQSISNETAALLSVLILVVNIILQVLLKPFYSNDLNTLEQYSLLICVLTMYIGIFQISAQDFASLSAVKYIFIFVILIPNLIFYPYWIWCAYIEILKICINNEKYLLFKILTLTFWHQEKFRQKYLGSDQQISKKRKATNVSDEHSSDRDDGIGDLKVVYKDENNENNAEGEDDQGINVKDIMLQLKQSGKNGEPQNQNEDFANINEMAEHKNQSQLQHGSRTPGDMRPSQTQQYASGSQLRIPSFVYQPGGPKKKFTPKNQDLLPKIVINRPPVALAATGLISQKHILNDIDKEEEPAVISSSDIHSKTEGSENSDSSRHKQKLDPLGKLYDLQQRLDNQDKLELNEKKLSIKFAGEVEHERDKRIYQVKDQQKRPPPLGRQIPSSIGQGQQLKRINQTALLGSDLLQQQQQQQKKKKSRGKKRKGKNVPEISQGASPGEGFNPMGQMSGRDQIMKTIESNQQSNRQLFKTQEVNQPKISNLKAKAQKPTLVQRRNAKGVDLQLDFNNLTNKEERQSKRQKSDDSRSRRELMKPDNYSSMPDSQYDHHEDNYSVSITNSEDQSSRGKY